MADVAKGLSRALKAPFTLSFPLDVDEPHRFIILSDQHKGARDGADDFERCEPAYLGALRHYLDDGYSLVLLGDVEELWEQGFDEVRRAYPVVLQWEAAFPANRYFRIWGNHDDRWMREKKVAKELSPYLPSKAVQEGIRFELSQAGESLGTLFLVHGHQGTVGSDKMRGFARLVLPFYRFLQRTTGIGKTTPAKDFCLRDEHDTQMYRWAEKQERLILIAGHTHRPVWCSRTHLQNLENELALALDEPPSPARDARVRQLETEIAERREKYPPCKDSLHTKPVYFNTGCCRFRDGDITGLELEDGELRLIKWTNASGTPARVLLESGRLTDFFAMAEGRSPVPVG